MQSVNWAKQHVDCGLSGDFAYQVGPAFSEWAVAQWYAASSRAEHSEVSAAFYLKSHVKRVFSSRSQFDINLEAAIRDQSVHQSPRLVIGD